MRETVRHNAPLALLLQAIVTNRLRGIQGLFQIACFQYALLLHAVPPDASEAVGLKLHAYGQTIHLRLRSILLHLAHFWLNAEQLLHVVADFMRDHVALGKIAVSAQLAFHVVIELSLIHISEPTRRS